MAFSISFKPPAPPAPPKPAAAPAPAASAPTAAPAQQQAAAAPAPAAASSGSKLEDAINQDTNHGGGAAGGIGGERAKWDGDSSFDLPTQSGGVVLNPDDLL